MQINTISTSRRFILLSIIWKNGYHNFNEGVQPTSKINSSTNYNERHILVNISCVSVKYVGLPILTSYWSVLVNEFISELGFMKQITFNLDIAYLL